MENHSLNCKINQLNKENKSKNELKDFNERLNGKEFNNINFYDIIINIKSIKDITKGWEVKMSKKMKEKYEDFKTNRSIKIGVLGNSNVGKTFLLSKLCKKDLPHGIRTEGLSIKYPDLSSNKDRNIILLDLCGFETPILTEENEKKDFNKNKELLYDRIYTEMFLQNFFLNQSDIPILVIGNLTFCEQKLLERIKSAIKNKREHKTLFVVHNLKNYSYIKEVKYYINNILLKCPNLDLGKGDYIGMTLDNTGVYYYEKNEENRVYHLIYSKENSEAGSYYNSFTLHYLENSYRNAINLKCFDVKKEIKNSFIEYSKDIFKNIEKLYLPFDDSNEKFIKLNYKNELLFKDIYFNEYNLPIISLEYSDFTPVYNYYKKNNKIIVKIEAPGNMSINCNITLAGEYNIINISGKKAKDKDFNITDNIFNSRKFGDFIINIPLKVDEFLLKNEPPKSDFKRGVFILEFDLRKKVDLDEGSKIDI